MSDPEATNPGLQCLLGSSTIPAVTAIGDRDVQLGEIVCEAFKASGLSVDDWNSLSDAERDEILSAQITEMHHGLAEEPQPGLTKSEDGTFRIGPGDQKRAEREAFEHAQKTVINPLNAETEKTTDESYIEGDGSSPGTLPEVEGK